MTPFATVDSVQMCPAASSLACMRAALRDKDRMGWEAASQVRDWASRVRPPQTPQGQEFILL